MTESTTYIYSDQVWSDGHLSPKTICIYQGKIKDLLAYKHDLAIDYTGYIIMPGVIDAHVHINEPGRTSWEGFDTATKAAALGGTTLLVDMPLNSSPVVTNIEAFNHKLNSAQNKLHVNCGFWAGAIGQEIENIIDLIEAGCLGVKVFLSHSGIEEFPNISIDDLSYLMSSLNKKNIPILAHCELDSFPPDTPVNNNPREYSNYLASRPASWEYEAIKVFIGLSELYNCRAHIVHLASEKIIPWIKIQKEKNIPFTVETCPHYLLFKASEIENGQTLLKCAPPIRTNKTRKGLIKGLKTGVIDFITTDHSPAPADLKEIESGDFRKAWGGISGLQFLLSSSWTALKGSISIEQFIPLLTEKPAKFLGLNHMYGSLVVDRPADMCIWDPKSTFIVKSESIAHRHKETPYLNRELDGKVIATYIDGKCIMKNGVLKAPNNGKIILRENEQVV